MTNFQSIKLKKEGYMRRLVIGVALLGLFACKDIQEEIKQADEIVNTEHIEEELVEVTQTWDDVKKSSQQALTELWHVTTQSGQEAWQDSKTTSIDFWQQNKEMSKQLWSELESGSQQAWSDGKQQMNQFFEEKDLTKNIDEI